MNDYLYKILIFLELLIRNILLKMSKTIFFIYNLYTNLTYYKNELMASFGNTGLCTMSFLYAIIGTYICNYDFFENKLYGIIICFLVNFIIICYNWLDLLI